MPAPAAPPRAFSGSRLGWADLPRDVRDRIRTLAGADVISETSATNGFSPGYAALVGLGDGTQVFVKAVSPDQNPQSPELARAEVIAAQHLPAGVPAPRLLWAHDDGHWVVLGLEAVEGRAPRIPWQPDELALALQALERLADVHGPGPGTLPDLGPVVARTAGGWARLTDDGATVDRSGRAVGEHGAWMVENLDRFTDWAGSAPAACVGSNLVHGDMRADNLILSPGPGRRLWMIDWPHAATGGAPWYDLLTMLPSVAMQRGGDPQEIFWRHAASRGADPDAVRSVLCAVTGYLVHESTLPPPPGVANLRPFQLAQARAALGWLRAVSPALRGPA
ncbi:aminoglycoside phosphotransferase [Cellulomonas bogoriensis 69B4 = DSM 16987]|uniref:Aminoglycoside phosphotransferase n=2 Tax=Cellulomonas bogoriensis TaxID=301388 RepID=A0A0A0BYV3_9CELL|nr:aminoglycoside phosphotransferase [Cellulomonas bogoriensis 69B4 = DSM 16987]